MVKNEYLTIAQLYGREMNIYGDNGNILTLIKRLEWRGFSTKLVHLEIGGKVPSDIDIIVGGGGQDAGQDKVKNDLLLKKQELVSATRDGVVMLMICGMYQLFGHKFVTSENIEIRGISIFDMVTKASSTRIIGNVIIDTGEFGKIVGFENHSGQTHLSENQKQFGIVIKGEGNNEITNEEGAVTNNVFGTYLHGPVLPKNYIFADGLIKRALKRKYGIDNLSEIDDEIATKAAKIAMKQPR